MTSFIDMMASDRWSEADIINRTEAMIAAEFTPNEVAIINRIVTAAAAGFYELTETEQADVLRYNQVCLEARAAGDAARADMRLLDQVLGYEAAQRTINAAGPDVVDLVQLRTPPADVEPPASEQPAVANPSA
jgi:hypothetical protein